MTSAGDRADIGTIGSRQIQSADFLQCVVGVERIQRNVDRSVRRAQPRSAVVGLNDHRRALRCCCRRSSEGEKSCFAQHVGYLVYAIRLRILVYLAGLKRVVLCMAIGRFPESMGSKTAGRAQDYNKKM